MLIHSRRIRLFRNGDPYFTGKRVNLSPIHHRLLEQFMIECSKDLNLRVKSFYTMDGVLVKDLDDFQDGQCYVASNGEAFKKIQYNDSESGPNFMAYSKPNLVIPPVKDNPLLERRKVNGSAGGLLSENVVMKGSEATLFTPDTKAFRVAIFENGNFNMEGVRMILNHRNCKSFDQLLRYFSSMKITKSGQVRKMYDAATGRRVRHLSNIENGMNLVLSAFDPFKQGNYKTILFRNNTTAGIKKREEEVPRVIKVYPNGDAYHIGLGMSVTKRNYPTLQRLMEKANTHIDLVTGLIKKMYTTDGVQITSIDEIQNGCGYVVVSTTDPFIKVQYNSMDLSRRPGTSYRGLQGHTLNNEFLEKIRPITKRGKREDKKDENNRRPYTSKAVKTPSTVKSKKQAVVSDGMETEAPSKFENSKTPEKIKRSESIEKKSQKQEEKDEMRVTPVPDSEEFAAQSEIEEVQEEMVVPRSPKATTRAKTAKLRPKTTAAQFEDPSETLPPLTREKNFDGRKNSIKVKKQLSSHTNNSVDTAPDTQSNFEIQEDDHLKGDSGRGEEELFQNESMPIQVLESTTPALSKKKSWFS